MPCCFWARKENTQCVLYSDPGQRVLYAFFTRFYVILRVFLLTHCARFLLRSATTRFFPAFLTRFFFKRVFFFHSFWNRGGMQRRFLVAPPPGPFINGQCGIRAALEAVGLVHEHIFVTRKILLRRSEFCGGKSCAAVVGGGSARNDLRFLAEQPEQPEQNGNSSAENGRISRVSCSDQRIWKWELWVLLNAADCDPPMPLW